MRPGEGLLHKRCISEHLGNPTNYKLISKAEGSTIQSLLSREFGSWLGRYSDMVPEHERVYLRTARDKYSDKFSKFRATVKIHKTPDWHNIKQDLRFRPIVACCGTWINCWSKWLDHYLQMLTLFVPTYSSGVQPILEGIRTIHDLPQLAFLFTSDADAIYNKIDTDHAIKSHWQLDEQTILQTRLPSQLSSGRYQISHGNHHEKPPLQIR